MKDNVQTHHRIDGRALATRILNECRAFVEEHGAVGRLVSISIGEVPEIAVYVRNQERGAAHANLPFETQFWPGDITQDEAKAKIQAMNDDVDVLGIILQRPVPDHINLRSLQSAIHPLKDVEGMNPASIGNIVYSDITLAPCTATASVELVKETGLDLKGLEVVMIGHSEIVGIPQFLGPDMIKPGAAVIDIGINQIDTPGGGSKIVGDVDTDAVGAIAGWITPVPGGVGPVTVAILMRNAIVAHQRQVASGWMD